MTKKEAVNIFNKELKKHFKNLLSGNIKRELANILTFSRGFISPFVLIPTILFCNPVISITAVSAFALTDLFDGKIARKFNSIDNFGKTLDAISDKFFEAGIAIPLIILNPILLINTILELIITKVNVKSFLNGNNPETTYLGKIKTAFLSSTLIFSYLITFINITRLPFYVLVGMTTLLQSAAIYQYKNIDDIKNIKKKNIKYDKQEQPKKEETNSEKTLTMQLSKTKKNIEEFKKNS